MLFGSNMGDREEIFDQSCLLINYRCGHVVQVSSAYESEPWGVEADQWFLNRVIVVETDLAPEEMWPDLTDGCDHYHAKYVKPFWAAYRTPKRIFGNHLFYSLKSF